MTFREAVIHFVQSFSRVQLFVTAWTTARQASLSIINSQSLPKLTSMELVMPSNHLILCHPLLPLPQSFAESGSFPMSQLFTSGGQRTGVSASAAVLPMNTQDWFPWGWTGWISLRSKRLSRVFSNTTVQKHQFFSSHSSLFNFSPHRKQVTQLEFHPSPMGSEQVTSVLPTMAWIPGYNSPHPVYTDLLGEAATRGPSPALSFSRLIPDSRRKNWRAH